MTELIDAKQSKREVFKSFINTMENTGNIIEEFDEGLWSSLVEEVVVKIKDDITFKFKNGVEIKA